MQVFFFAINKRGHPHSWLDIGAPAVEMEVPARMSVATVGAVEAHHMKILILNPNPPQKTPTVVFPVGRHIEHQATYLAQKFAPHIVELIVLFIETVGVD